MTYDEALTIARDLGMTAEIHQHEDRHGNLQPVNMAAKKRVKGIANAALLLSRIQQATEEAQPGWTYATIFRPRHDELLHFDIQFSIEGETYPTEETQFIPSSYRTKS